MNVFRLWVALTRMVLAGRGGYAIGAVIWNPHDPRDPHVAAVGYAANWQVVDLDWVGGGDRFAVLSCEPDAQPEYGKRVERLRGAS